MKAFLFLTTVVDIEAAPRLYLHNSIEADDEGEARRIAMQMALDAKPEDWRTDSIGVDPDADDYIDDSSMDFYSDVGEVNGKKIVGLPPYHWSRSA